MPTYLANYTVRAYMMDAGHWMPDPDPHNEEYKFDAENDNIAKDLAKKHLQTFREKYFSPNSTLDRLVRIQEIEILKSNKI